MTGQVEAGSRNSVEVAGVRLNGDRRSLLDFRYEDLDQLDYRHHPATPAPVSV